MPKSAHSMRRHTTVEDIEVRRQALLDVILETRKKRKLLTRKAMIDGMKKKGFDVDVATLYRDRTALNRTNNFVRDLAESNYSAIQEDIQEVLDWVEQEAERQYRKTWTNSKTVKKEIPTNEGLVEIEEVTTTGEVAAAKAAFLKIIKEVQELKNKLIHGENIQLSVALLKDKIRKLESENEELKKSGDVKTAIPAKS